MSDKVIRILLVDDHYVVRMGLMGILNLQPDMSVVGEAEEGGQAIKLYETLRPDVVLMDVRMPGMGGIEAVAAIRLKFPEARVIMLTTYDGTEEIYRALQAGVQGYLLKNMSGAEVVQAIRSVHQGHRFIPAVLGNRVAERIPCSDLTSRELEVLQLLAKGLSNKEIATYLNFTEHTAKAHLKNILGKLGVEDRTKAVVTALQRGIIKLD